MSIRRPRGLLFDYGGTLVEEVAFDPRAGNEALLARASYLDGGVTLDDVLRRAERVSRDVADRRDRFQIETPWVSLTRLIHDFFGTRFADPPSELEVAFWDASVTTRAMPGALEALSALHDRGLPMGVVSNTSFGQHVIRHELNKYGLADHLAIVVASADYVVRKPNPLLFETAAALLGVPCSDIWFVGDRLDTDVAGARAAGMTTVWLTQTTGAPPAAVDLAVASWEAFSVQVQRSLA